MNIPQRVSARRESRGESKLAGMEQIQHAASSGPIRTHGSMSLEETGQRGISDNHGQPGSLVHNAFDYQLNAPVLTSESYLAQPSAQVSFYNVVEPPGSDQRINQLGDSIPVMDYRLTPLSSSIGSQHTSQHDITREHQAPHASEDLSTSQPISLHEPFTRDLVFKNKQKSCYSHEKGQSPYLPTSAAILGFSKPMRNGLDVRFTNYIATRECSLPTISPISPNPQPSFPLAGRGPSNPLATTTSPLPLIEPHRSFCKPIHRPIAMSDTQAWSQEPQVHGALRQPEAPVAYSQLHAWPYEATPFSGPGFGPNTGLTVVDLGIQPPDAGAPVNSFPSAYQQDTQFDSSKVELPANGSITVAPSALSASVPQQQTPAETGRNRFECEDCHKMFDRPSRLDNCRNLHRGIRPWQCGGRCQDPTCDATYACADYLRRHLLSNDERCTRCQNCNQDISKQNMARHRASCV